MNFLDKYIHFCRLFHKYNLPKIKFKDLNENYKLIYRKFYNIDEDDINKSSFLIFVLSFLSLIMASILLISLNYILIILFYSVATAFLVSLKFNLVIYNKIKKEESVINAALYLIKINFSLLQKSLNENSDYCINFIELIKNYKIPISESFEIILKKIHEGESPEENLIKLITPSNDFNLYIRELLLNNFNYNYDFNDSEEISSEKKIKIYLRDIESKLSLIFFVGLFFPIGLCFFILFYQVNIFFLLTFIALFLTLLNFLFRIFVKVDVFLIGLLKEHSKIERRKFDEFLSFLKSFSINLKNNISPEMAFFKAYSEHTSFLKLLNNLLKIQLSHLLNLSCSFTQMLTDFGLELKSIRYVFILNTIQKMIEENSYYAANKIFELLSIIHKHKKIENKLDVIISGEKFKVFIFLFLLPIIIGAISGTLPFFNILIKNLNIDYNDISFSDYLININFFDVLVVFITLLLSNLITSYYFLKIINYEKMYFLILISTFFFILTFFVSFTNILLLI